MFRCSVCAINRMYPVCHPIYKHNDSFSDHRSGFTAGYDQCQARVHARCHEERERCAKDCEMYSETSAKCPEEKCRLVRINFHEIRRGGSFTRCSQPFSLQMHRACHRLYTEACDDSHPVNWVALGDLNQKAQEQQDICRDRYAMSCDRSRSVQ